MKLEPDPLHDYAVFSDQHGRLLAIKKGWSWPAFLYGPLWAMYRKLWLPVGIYLAAILLCTLLELQAGWISERLNFWSSALLFCINGALGIKGNDQLHKRYIRLGYHLIGRNVRAASVHAALQRYRTELSARQERREEHRNKRRAQRAAARK
ncbi:hypothetical protein DBR37_06570 [Herminiimonas sp. KBW02]|uniref:DUF2628 domain-containing protein n=1 Tax=Herminiimonas sp. KBW02 TaxID=2153363 RepID=UPI000F5AFF02|nr:DUF2628 domain-containing protein [Herminiimonas sp. KBW02]RQO36003.1 hypothetical protein DBR37_06570 [Herminiimonas sp. KBW02]